MLTRFVRIQLAIFAATSVIGMVAMLLVYMQLPTLVGLGRITVTLKLPEGGGLYDFANVTYRGVKIGEVTKTSLTADGAEATLSLDTSPRIPANLMADVRSISAVGEQYVNLDPRTDSPPYLDDGAVISSRDTSVPQQVGPMLDQVSALVQSIPKDKLGQLLDESAKGFDGAGYDFGSLLDSSAKIAADSKAVADRAGTLIDDSEPLLDSQFRTTDSIRTWTRSLAGFTDQLVTNDPQLRTLLRDGPGAAQEATKLLDQLKPTLPVLLANLTSLGQVGVTYHDSIRQLLVLLPPYAASTQSFALQGNNPTGLPLAAFSLQLGDPPACTVGFLPPSQWRSPADTSTIDTPDNLYCKLPQDSPISVRGARNYPCQGVPGKRAPTVEICNSAQPFEPLAQRQHTLGPYPLDPNLIAQGVPPDNRVNPDANIYGPLEGTPRPPGQNPAPPAADAPPAPPAADAPPAPPAADAPPGPSPGASDAVPAAPSGYGSATGPAASVAIARYDPQTGRYMTPDGQVFRQTDLAEHGTATSWKQLVLGS